MCFLFSQGLSWLLSRVSGRPTGQGEVQPATSRRPRKGPEEHTSTQGYILPSCGASVSTIQCRRWRKVIMPLRGYRAQGRSDLGESYQSSLRQGSRLSLSYPELASFSLQPRKINMKPRFLAGHPQIRRRYCCFLSDTLRT